MNYFNGMKIALAVPNKGPCGILDYSNTLRNAYCGEMDIIKEPLFKASGYDCLHVQFEATMFRKGRTTVFPQLMEKNKNIPRVVTVHEVWDTNPYVAKRPTGNGLPSFLRRLKYDVAHSLEMREERLARLNYLCDNIIVHTRYAKHLLIKKGCDPDKISVLPLPVVNHLPDPREVAGIPRENDKLIILMFGFISPAIDYNTVFQALKEVKYQYTLIIAGTSRRPVDASLDVKVNELVKQYGLEKHVFRTGFVENRDLDALFTAANVFIHAPLFKTASWSLANALGADLPIIAPDLPHIQEINAERYCIKTYPQGDTDRLATCLKDFFDKTERVNARKKIRDYANDHPPAKFAESHLSLYRRLCEHRN